MVQQPKSIPEFEVSPWWVDTKKVDLVKLAWQIYQKCYESYPEKAEQMEGVVINRETYRGQLIFRTDNPILLPSECFIPTEEFNSQE